MVLRQGQITCSREPEGKLFSQEEKEGGRELNQLGQIFAMETLQTHPLVGADQKFAGQLCQNFDVAEDIAAGKIRFGFVIRTAQERLDHAAANDIESVPRIAG